MLIWNKLKRREYSRQRRRQTKSLLNVDYNARLTLKFSKLLTTTKKKWSVKDDQDIQERTIENISSLLHESDSTIISKQFQTFIYPFHLSNEFFRDHGRLNEQISRRIFPPLFRSLVNETSIENLHLFCSNLYSQNYLSSVDGLIVKNSIFPMI